MAFSINFEQLFGKQPPLADVKANPPADKQPAETVDVKAPPPTTEIKMADLPERDVFLKSLGVDLSKPETAARVDISKQATFARLEQALPQFTKQLDAVPKSTSQVDISQKATFARLEQDMPAFTNKLDEFELFA